MAIKKLANNSNQPPKKNAAQTGGAKNTPQVKKISLNAPIKTSSVVNQKTDSIFNSSSAFGKKPAVSLSSTEEQEAMQAIFHHLDTDEDGKVNEEELTYLTSMHDDNDEGEEITEEDVNLYLEKMEGERQQTLDRFQGALGQWVGGIDDVIAKYFPSKSLDEISDEDIQRAVFADMLSSNTANARNNIEQYFDSEGWADDAYNWLKGITDLGITRDDINEYLQNEEMFNNILLSSLNNGGSLELVDSDEPQEELLANGQISTSMLQGIIEQRLSSASSIEEIMDYSQNYLGLDGEDVLNSIMSTMLDQQLKYSPYCAQYNPEDLQFEITQGEDGEYYISSDYSLLSGKVLDVNGLTVDEYFELYLAGDLKQNVVESISSKWQENTPESISFDDTYSFFTGVKYDPQAIQEANEAQIVYQHAISLQQGASYQEELFASFNSPRQVYDYFVQMYENDPSAQGQFTKEEYASSMFNSYYDSLFENGLVTGDARIDLRCTSFHISPDGKTITEVYSAGDFFSESYLNEGEVYDEKTGTVTRQYNIEYDPVSDSYYSQTLSDTFACINRVVDDEDLFVQSTIDGFNEQYGENAFNLAIQDYQEKFETAYGNNILNSKFDSYQVDMDSYSQKLSTFIAMGGFAMSFVNPAFGFVALGGAYTDNAIDLVNLATNEKGGEFGDWFLSTMKDVCYTAVGFKLGAWANQSGNKLMGFLMNKGVSQNAALGLGTGGEYILDVASGTAFDLATSYMETGNIYLAQNLMNNFLFGSADFRGGVGLYRALHAGYDIDVDVSGNIKVVDPDGANSARPAVFGSADTDAPAYDSAKNIDTSDTDSAMPEAYGAEEPPSRVSGYDGSRRNGEGFFARFFGKKSDPSAPKNGAAASGKTNVTTYDGHIGYNYPSGKLVKNAEYSIPFGSRVKIGKTDFDLDSIGLRPGETVVVGREGAGRANYTIPDDKVSARHLQVTATETGYRIQDLGSLNGTVVSFEPLTLKHRNGTTTVHKNISSRTYGMLFPTDDGVVHSNSKQHSNGDCYLLSSINAIFENPQSRNTILDCFTENPDGSITFRLPNGQCEYDYNRAMAEIRRSPYQYSQTSPGLQAIEYAYGCERWLKAAQIKSNQCKVTSDAFATYVSDRMKLKNRRYEDSDIITFRAGGWPAEALSMFGYDSLVIDNPRQMARELQSTGGSGDYIFILSTKRLPDGSGDDHFWDQGRDIAGSHSYLLRPNKNSNMVFDLVNPWHSSKVSCQLTLPDIESMGYFANLTVAKVK